MSEVPLHDLMRVKYGTIVIQGISLKWLLAYGFRAKREHLHSFVFFTNLNLSKSDQLLTTHRSPSNTFTGWKDFYLTAKARIWP